MTDFVTPAIAFRRATPADIPLLRFLADRIWRTSYADMLSEAQIDYMLDWMYGPATITAELKRGVVWELVEAEREPVGFLAATLQPGGDAELHKLYLVPARQGRGEGQAMLARVEAIAAARGSTGVTLRVNKTNTRAQRAYQRAGFTIVDDIVADIGGGFVMDDFVLAKPIDAGAASAVPRVKICGLSTPDTLEAALLAGADMIGLVFFPRSPRHVSLEAARALAEQARGRAGIVALTVDVDDTALDAIVQAVVPDWLQLHGREHPMRAQAVRQRFGIRTIKAIGLSTAADLTAADPFATAVDQILFDAKPPERSSLPGGNGVPFDWTMLKGYAGPYMLSGGLTPDTVAEAVAVSGAGAVDVSSGVERMPGLKDPGLIRAFVAAAKGRPR